MFEHHPAGSDLAVQKQIQQRQMVLMVYVLYALAPPSVGLTGLLAVAINHVQRGRVRGSFYESHFHWQMRLFWESMVWLALGFLTMGYHYIGLFFWFLGLIRFVYRLVVGLYCMNRSQLLPIERSSET